MKHAYLIMAHNDWDLLRILISCLDDERNDIFVHIDAKVAILPELRTEKALLKMIADRKDVRWGDVSVVEAEYALLEAAAAAGPYAYYHLLSGADLPLKSQDYIHSFCDGHQGREFIGYTLTGIAPEIVLKARRWHILPRHFRSGNLVLRALRKSFILAQEALGIERNKDIDFKKGSQWVSITDGLARYVLAHRDWTLRTFRNTFCSDEMFVQTLCWMSPFKENIFSTDNDALGCMRAIGWKGSCLCDWSAADYDTLAASDALFARKFNSRDMDFIERIKNLSR